MRTTLIAIAAVAMLAVGQVQAQEEPTGDLGPMDALATGKANGILPPWADTWDIWRVMPAWPDVAYVCLQDRNTYAKWTVVVPMSDWIQFLTFGTVRPGPRPARTITDADRVVCWGPPPPPQTIGLFWTRPLTLADGRPIPPGEPASYLVQRKTATAAWSDYATPVPPNGLSIRELLPLPVGACYRIIAIRTGNIKSEPSAEVCRPADMTPPPPPTNVSFTPTP